MAVEVVVLVVVGAGVCGSPLLVRPQEFLLGERKINDVHLPISRRRQQRVKGLGSLIDKKYGAEVHGEGDDCRKGIVRQNWKWNHLAAAFVRMRTIANDHHAVLRHFMMTENLSSSAMKMTAK